MLAPLVLVLGWLVGVYITNVVEKESTIVDSHRIWFLKQTEAYTSRLMQSASKVLYSEDAREVEAERTHAYEEIGFLRHAMRIL